jgi:2-dehydropantoate 2-reductase
MRIAVFGTGAVGEYFGGRLAQAGEDVVFIACGGTVASARSGAVSEIGGVFYPYFYA